MPDQYAVSNPVDRYPHITPPASTGPEPGTEQDLQPAADHGEESYRGTGRLTGRRALVTGADSGIGAAVAIAFAREGADVAMSYLPAEEEDARRIAGLVEEAGRTALTLPGDISDPQHCRQLVEQTVSGLGGLDVLVNNAGKQQYVERLEDLADEQFDQTMRTNVYAMFWLTKAALPHLEPGAVVINTTSMETYKPNPGLVDYATTKAAINAFTKATAQQLAPRGVRVNAVAPGPVWTPLQTSGGQPAEKLPHFGETTPLGRPGQPAEVAPAYVFLASQESSFVAGDTLNVNGGMPTP